MFVFANLLDSKIAQVLDYVLWAYMWIPHWPRDRFLGQMRRLQQSHCTIFLRGNRTGASSLVRRGLPVFAWWFRFVTDSGLARGYLSPTVSRPVRSTNWLIR